MDAKAAARETVERARPALVSLSHRIHEHPEIGFEEERASAWLCDALAEAGFAVERGVYELPTAFVARAGSGPLHLAICAEYDCAPGYRPRLWPQRDRLVGRRCRLRDLAPRR